MIPNHPIPPARQKHLSIVVPFFNEGPGVEAFDAALQPILSALPDYQVEIVCVDDGSTDDTLERLLALATTDGRYRLLELSRNFGKEAALTAGLHAACGQAVVPIDVDLQDPPEVVIDMVARWREGHDVVIGRRRNRSADSLVKRGTAAWFYRVHNAIARPRIPENVGDFRLMDRAVVDALKALPESHRFMKGLFAWVGFEPVTVDYTRAPRVAGSSKFNGWRLWNFALEGLTSFSHAPLRIWTYLGFVVALSSFAFAVFILVRVLLMGVDVPGYASLMVAVTFLGGLQLIGIGVIGEYLGRAYIEAKRRPVYLVRKTYEPGD